METTLLVLIGCIVGFIAGKFLTINIKPLKKENNI